MKGRRTGVSGQPIYMGKRFNWDEFDRARKAIYFEIVKSGVREVTLDFKRTEVVMPNGIAPLVALVEHYKRAGVEFRITPPFSVDLNRIASLEGWFHAIDPSHFKAPESRGFNTLPLIHYTNDDELNDAVNRAIEVSLRQLSLARNVPDAFEWSLNELAGNVLHHAQGVGGYMQVSTFKSSSLLSITVVDAGIGVPASMRESFPDIRNDRIAVEKAVQKGVTSKPHYGQGNGLAGALAIALQSGGYMSLTSGGGRLTTDGGRVTLRDFYPPIFGTVVELQLPTDREIDLPAALGHRPSGYVEERYEQVIGTLRVEMAKCAPTLGNRPTGEKVRNLIGNLLSSSPGSVVEVDFAGVQIIASSFADEVFGKLFVSLGPLEYGSRLRFVGVNGMVKEIVNKAILERVAQGM